MNLVHPTVAKRCGGIAARSLAVAGCAALLAACTTANQVTGSMPSDYRQRHPIVLQEAPRAVDLLIGDRRGTLTGPQRAEVLAFAREWVRESTGGILIDVPSGTSNANAAANATHEVRSILAASGVPPQAIELRTYRPNDPAKLATLRLHYPKVRADAGPCGLWPKDLGPTNDREHLENRTYWNFGCATQRNLAAMVDNPADLVQPRSDIPAYTGRRTTVLDKYHRGESSATTYADSNRGKISDVGQ